MTSSYSPVLTTKAVKDETEQRILRDAHVRHLCTLTTALLRQQNLLFARICLPVMKLSCQSCQPLSYWSLPVGERRRGRHAAADVAGESSPSGDGDRADGCRIRQHVSQVSTRVTVEEGAPEGQANECWWFLLSVFTKDVNILTENRKTTKGPALRPFLQVGPMLHLPTTGKS